VPLPSNKVQAVQLAIARGWSVAKILKVYPSKNEAVCLHECEAHKPKMLTYYELCQPKLVNQWNWTNDG